MSLRSYQRYKASGTDWFPKVPEHWTVKRLRQIGPLLKGTGGSKEDITEEGIQCVRYGDLYTTHAFLIREARTRVAPETSATYTAIRKGDVLFAASGETFEEIGKSAANLIGETAVCGGDVVILRPTEEVIPEFLGFACDSQVAAAQKAAMGRGTTVKHIYPDELSHLLIALPPLDEQRMIARFLESEFARIDALVKEQLGLIELLKEKRQALVSQTVTKGLSPAVSMKPSGVEWLGDVPKHWNVLRIGSLFREVAEPGSEELPILSVSIHHGVSDDEMSETEMDRKVTRSEDRSTYKRVRAGDLVYNMMRAWQGGFGAVLVEGMVSPAYVVARPKTDLGADYLELVLRTPQAIEQMRRFSKGVTDFRLRLYWDEFKSMQVPVPPRAEAAAICSAIQSMDAQTGDLLGTCESSIRLLLERRSAVIAAAVTGQVDVRGLADTQAA